MISANNVTLRIGKKALFEDVNIKFTEGNCYGLIGANGAGGPKNSEKEYSGDVVDNSGKHSFLKRYQVWMVYVMDTLSWEIKIYEIMKEKDAIYAKEDFSDEDGIRASELEAELDMEAGREWMPLPC